MRAVKGSVCDDGAEMCGVTDTFVAGSRMAASSECSQGKHTTTKAGFILVWLQK